MNRKSYSAIVLVSLSLLLVSATILEAKAAAAIVLNPTTGAPGTNVAISGTGFAASNTTGIGWGPQVAVAHDTAIVTAVGSPLPLEFYGTASQHPIKPGSFKYTFTQGALELYFGDKGDGTLSDPQGGRLSIGTINYTSGYFHCIMSSSTTLFNAGYFSYTTYYFNSINSTFPILPTDASGAMSVTLTVPQIWNGSETVWVIDEKGHVGSGNFTVVNSSVIPEPLTLGGVIVLSSAALIVSVYFLRKKPAPKVAA
jgi:hypothetical protein